MKANIQSNIDASLPTFSIVTPESLEASEALTSLDAMGKRFALSMSTFCGVKETLSASFDGIRLALIGDSTSKASAVKLFSFLVSACESNPDLANRMSTVKKVCSELCLAAGLVQRVSKKATTEHQTAGRKADIAKLRAMLAKTFPGQDVAFFSGLLPATRRTMIAAKSVA